MTTHAQDPKVPPAAAAVPGAPASTPAAAPAPVPAPERAEGGEPACLLHLVCPDCGRLADERGARTCSRCGGPLPAPGP
ncbi:hypothetical protein ACFXGI_07210 [Streptomyces sp. NPDC059355]|uniref:hypothetical protein n=1 Tax=Streptomyces sp. NPDC059355 TaxID=3346811 RepID=UPI0036C1D437